MLTPGKLYRVFDLIKDEFDGPFLRENMAPYYSSLSNACERHNANSAISTSALLLLIKEFRKPVWNSDTSVKMCIYLDKVVYIDCFTKFERILK